MTLIVEKKKRTQALIKLLEDANTSIAAAAMEQLLAQEELDTIVANYQDSAHPVLRQRIHQLDNIAARRKMRRSLLERLHANDITLWEAFRDLNVITDTQMSASRVNELFEAINRPFKRRHATVMQVVSYMIESDFKVTDENTPKIEHYNISEVLEFRRGSALTLAVIAQKLGVTSGWNANICLYNGRYCLVDTHRNLIDITDGWRISRVQSNQFYVCTRQELFNCLVCSLIVAANSEGILKDFYFYSKFYADLQQIDLRQAGYPFDY